MFRVQNIDSSLRIADTHAYADTELTFGFSLSPLCRSIHCLWQDRRKGSWSCFKNMACGHWRLGRKPANILAVKTPRTRRRSKISSFSFVCIFFTHLQKNKEGTLDMLVWWRRYALKLPKLLVMKWSSGIIVRIFIFPNDGDVNVLVLKQS